MSKNFLEVGLEAIAEMMGFPRFDSDEIDNEREVVIEEIKRGLDNPHRQASRQLFSTVYKKHPYRLPVIGYADNIKEVSRETLVNYYQSRYVPKNMTLLVVGDFENKELKPLVEKWFGDFEPYQLNKVKRNKEPKQEKSRIQVQSTSFQEWLFYIAWPVPSAQHKDIPALDVMSLILGQGSSSRLTRSLKIEKGLVNYIGASSFTPKDKGFAAVSMSMNPDKLPEADPSSMNFSSGSSKPKSWKEIWGAGQGIGAVKSVGPTADLVGRIHREFVAAQERLKARLG